MGRGRDLRPWLGWDRGLGDVVGVDLGPRTTINMGDSRARKRGGQTCAIHGFCGENGEHDEAAVTGTTMARGRERATMGVGDRAQVAKASDQSAQAPASFPFATITSSSPDVHSPP